MTRATTWKAALIALPLLAFAIYAALNWFRLEEEPTYSGLGREARQDAYLAYARLLERMGQPPRRVESPSELEAMPRGGTLVIAGRRLAYMTPARVRSLVAWVESGGHLVAEWERDRTDDPLVDAFGVARTFPEEAPRPPFTRRDFDPGDFAGPAQNIVTFEWPWLGAPLRARAGVGAGELTDERKRTGVDEVRQGKRLVAMSFPQGRGRVTLLPTLRFMRNGNIADLDDAELAWRLSSERTPVVMYVRLQSAGLMDWIQRDAWPAFAAAALLLALWLMRIIPRLGPLEPDEAPPRRSLLEHLAASGRFLWSRGASAPLLDAVRERASRSARRQGVSAQPIAAHAPGASSAPLNPAAFTNRIAALQKLEQELAPRTSPKKGKKP
jgi:hypothetical protein